MKTSCFFSLFQPRPKAAQPAAGLKPEHRSLVISLVLDIRNLTVKRNGRFLLQGINWQVRRGEHWAVLGANGSGKSTLLHSVLAMTPFSSGHVRVEGLDYGRAPWNEIRGRTGLVSDEIRFRLREGQTALEVVTSGKGAGINHWQALASGDMRVARSLMKSFGVENQSDQTWETLSQGEKQRVLIARAMMAEPALLFLDEPCAGLDPVQREKFLSFLDIFLQKQTGVPLIFVTHHIEEILPSITHVLMLRAGRVLYSGPRSGGLEARMLEACFHARFRLRESGGRFYPDEIKSLPAARQGNG